ncbi:serine/threonine-protein kinase [Novipirellula herctigrandis]
MPAEHQSDDQVENRDNQFIEICLQQKLLDTKTAGMLQSSATEQGSWIGQTAVRHGVLSPADIDIVESLLHPKNVVPGYEILSVVGRGGMGVVYVARQIDLDRIVALKTILVGSATHPTNAARFEREAKALARLQHPNIVQALNFGKHEGRYFFAMEFVKGRTCEEAVTRETVLAPAKVWMIVRQVASGLLHARHHDLIHRDIKPANLILLPPPEGSVMASDMEVVKIADFGLAVFANDHADEMKLTTADKIIGSPAYMSPEQFSHEAVDFRSDVYALGATAWHLLFGAPPLRAKSLAALSVLKSKPLVVDRSSLPVQIPEDQMRLLLRMMAPKRDKRPGSYEELLQQIDRLSDIDSGASSHSPVALGKSADLLPPDDSTSDALTQTMEMPHTEMSVASARDNSTGSHSKGWIAIASLAVIILLGGFAFVSNAKPMRGPRVYTRVLRSTPLFDGITLGGWSTDGTMIGAWNTVVAPDSSNAIASTSKRTAITRRISQTGPHRISLFLWPQSGSGVVDIDFALDSVNANDVRGCLRFTDNEILLGHKRSDFGTFDKFVQLAAPEAMHDRFVVVDIEYQKADWYVFLEEKLVGTLRIDEVGQGDAIRLVTPGGTDVRAQPPLVYFSDLWLSELAEQ